MRSFEDAAARLAVLRSLPRAGELVNVAAVIGGRRGMYQATVERVLRSGRVCVLIERSGAAGPVRVITDITNVSRSSVPTDKYTSDTDWEAELDRLLVDAEQDTTPHEGI